MEKFNRNDVEVIRKEKKEVTLKLTDERDALKRAMLSFSDLEKETVKLNEKNYSIKLKYYSSDEDEILIRILEFGPFIKVESPEEFVEKIRKRLRKQQKLLEKQNIKL